MLEPNIFLIYLKKFNELNIEYAVTGSVASIVYGEPRLTHDIDLVILLEEEKINELSQSFPDTHFYFPPEEVILAEIKRSSRGHFNILHFESGFKADIYLTGSDLFQKWALKNKRTYALDGNQVFIAPAEYVIIKKLEFYKEGGSDKHIRDIKNIFKYSKDLINTEFLEDYLKNLGLLEIYERNFKN